TKRTHRWTRGDWQLLPWLFGRHAGNKAVPSVGRGKMLDNLRRSLLGPSTFLALGVAWLLPMPSALIGTLILIACVAFPAVLAAFSSVFSRRGGVLFGNRMSVFL